MHRDRVWPTRLVVRLHDKPQTGALGRKKITLGLSLRFSDETPVDGLCLWHVPTNTCLSGICAYPPNSRRYENQSVTPPITAAITNQTTPVNNVDMASTK